MSGCAGNGIDGGKLPGDPGSGPATGTGTNDPNAAIVQQTFLVSNRNSTGTYATNVNLIGNDQTLNSVPFGRFTPTGGAGSVSLKVQSTNTTNPNFGLLFDGGSVTISPNTNAALATNWSAVRPNPNPSPGAISYFVYTVQGLETFGQQVAKPIPTPAPVPVPTPQPIFNPTYVGVDSVGIALMTVPVTQTFQPPTGTGAFAANLSQSIPELPSTIPASIGYPLGARLYANYVHPNQKFMYLTLDGSVLVYRLENNGAITETQVIGTGTGTSQAKAGAFSSTGEFFYVACDSGHVAAFRVNQQSGQLSAVPGSPFTTAAGSLGLSFDRTGKFLYVVNQVAQSLSGFGVDATTGALTSLPNFPIGLTPNSYPAFITAHPTKDVLYMTNMGSNAPVSRSQISPPGLGNYTFPPTNNFLTVWTVAPDSGQLTLLENEVGTFLQRNMLNLATDAAGRVVYVTCAADPQPFNVFGGETIGTYGGGIEAFRVNNDGSVSFQTSGAEGSTGGARVDPNGILPISINNRAQ